MFFIGEPNVSIDFHEAEDLYAQWADINKTSLEETPRLNQVMNQI